MAGNGVGLPKEL